MRGQREREEILIAEVRRATLRNKPRRAAAVAAQAMVAFAAAEPETALLLLDESPLAGPPAAQARERLLSSLSGLIEDAHRRVPRKESLPDIPPRLACGVTSRMLASRLRQNRAVEALSSEIGAWLARYESPLAKHRWSGLVSSPPADRSPFLPQSALLPPPAAAAAPAAIEASRPCAGAAQTTAENEWLRIAFATVHTVDRDGYQAATVGEIARQAGVDPRAMQATFAGKPQALAAAQELLFRHLMAVAAGAFVAGDSWSSRLWEAARALTQCAEQNAALTRVSLLHPCVSDSLGGGLPQDVTAAFTVFLREGAHTSSDGPPSAAPRSDTELEAIITAIADLAFQHVQAAPEAPLTDLLARVVFLATAPFLGTAHAAELGERGASERAAPTTTLHQRLLRAVGGRRLRNSRPATRQ
jgi:hypothetical protein